MLMVYLGICLLLKQIILKFALELVMRKPSIQFSQLIMWFYCNENFDSTLMDIFKNNWDSQLEYVVSLFNICCNTNIIKK
jgi:hypothetical protein